MLEVEMRVNILLQAALTERTNVAFRDGRLIPIHLKVPFRAEGDWVDLTAADLIYQNNRRVTIHHTGATEVALEQLDANDANKEDKMVVQTGSLITHENNAIANKTTNATLTSLGAAFFKERRMV